MIDNWTLILSGGRWQELRGHLFPGDSGEHGTVIGAGIARTDRWVRLLAQGSTARRRPRGLRTR